MNVAHCVAVPVKMGANVSLMLESLTQIDSENQNNKCLVSAHMSHGLLIFAVLGETGGGGGSFLCVPH